ncbi:MAG: hypothetical protein R3Y23_07165 [Bacillota bacterium]
MNMFSVKQDINRKDYIDMSLYYLKRYIGARQIGLIITLFVVGIILYFWTGGLTVLILGAGTMGLLALAIIIYISSSIAGFKIEFTNRQATHWVMDFETTGFTIDTYEKNGSSKFTEKCTYEKIEKVAIRKDRVYIYVGSAVMFVVKHDSFTYGNFIEFIDFIKEQVDSTKLKMRHGKKIKQFPYSR